MIFLVEAYQAGHDGSQPEVAGRAAEAASGGSVRYLAGLAVPGDDLVFRVFVAGSRDALASSLDAAAVPVNRISEVLDFGFSRPEERGLADLEPGS